MEKIYFDLNIFIYISKGLKGKNKKYSDLYTELLHLKDNGIIKIYYSFFHIYEKAKSFTGDNEEIIKNEIIDMNLLVDNNYIEVYKTGISFSEKDPIELYYEYKPHFAICLDFEKLIYKYYKLIFLFNENIVNFIKTEEKDLENISKNKIINLIDDTINKKINEYSFNEKKEFINKIYINLKKNIPDYFDEVFEILNKHLGKHLSNSMIEQIKAKLKKSKEDSIKNIEKIKGISPVNLKNYLNATKAILIENSFSKQMLPGVLQASLDILKICPDKKRTKKRKNFIIDKEDMMHFNCANLCDIFVLNDINFFKRNELVNIILNSNLKLMDIEEFIVYINNRFDSI